MRHMYGKILVAIDGSETSIKALDHAVELAKIHGSSINLIAVIEELITSMYMLPLGEAQSLAMVLVDMMKEVRDADGSRCYRTNYEHETKAR